MSASPRILRRLARPLALVTTAAVLVLPLSASGAESEQAQRAQDKLYGKKFAAIEYQWYPIAFWDYFEEGRELKRQWARQGTRWEVGTQTGMLTIRTTRNDTVGATLRTRAHTTGRWELRLRGQQCAQRRNPCLADRVPGNPEFRVAAELIPARKALRNCGARNIALTTFKPQGSSATYYARAPQGGANREFSRTKQLKVTTDKWHTYAVELRRNRIAWFMDGKVIAAMPRPAATRIPMKFRLQLQSPGGSNVNEAQLQVDTVRYFTLKSPRAKPSRTRADMGQPRDYNC